MWRGADFLTAAGVDGCCSQGGQGSLCVTTGFFQWNDPPSGAPVEEALRGRESVRDFGIA